MNAIPLLGIVLSHQDRWKAHFIYPVLIPCALMRVKHNLIMHQIACTKTAEINPVGSVAVLSQKSRLVRAAMSPVIPGNNELLIEPSSDVLEAYGVTARESLVVGSDGCGCTHRELQ